MTAIIFQWTGDGIARLTTATQALEGSRKFAALRRALNHTGDKAFTLVKRTLAKQMGLSSQALFKDGRTLVKRRAMGANLEYQIVSGGRAVRMKEFRWHKTAHGITAYPWNVRHSFRAAFVIPSYGGNLYRRLERTRFPIEALLGPNINKELIKDATAAAFNQVVNASLPARVEHEVRVLTNGVVS